MFVNGVQVNFDILVLSLYTPNEEVPDPENPKNKTGSFNTGGKESAPSPRSQPEFSATKPQSPASSRRRQFIPPSHQLDQASPSSIQDQALTFIKTHVELLFTTFADKSVYTPNQSLPLAYFMAGSPGAEKTEYAKSFLLRHPSRRMVRIDADEIREILPQYDGINAQEVQQAAGWGVQRLFNYVITNKQDFILDGTFSAGYSLMEENIKKALKKGRKAHIIYLYKEPVAAWEFTKKRKRIVPQNVFVHAFFAANENVKKIKAKFGDAIEVTLVVKNNNGTEDIYVDASVDTIDKIVKMPDEAHSLETLLKE